MENSIKLKLRRLKNKLALEETSMSYVKTLLNMYLDDFSLFEYTCDIFDLSHEELMFILNNSTPASISFLDEVINVNMEYLEKKQNSNKYTYKGR